MSPLPITCLLILESEVDEGMCRLAAPGRRRIRMLSRSSNATIAVQLKQGDYLSYKMSSQAVTSPVHHVFN
jgi:hypothetical protein